MKRFLVLLTLLALAPSLSYAATNSVDVLYSGSGYVPPFYEGRTLWGRQTQVTFYAVPHVFTGSGREIPASQLIFRWSKDGTILGLSSGLGQDSISFNDTVIGLPIEIKVDVMTDSSTVVASSDASYAPVTPFLLTYENSPTNGYLFNHEASQGITMSGPEITLAGFPFLFSTSNKATRVNYAWTTGTSRTQSGEDVTYRISSGQSGQSAIGVTADLPQVLSQTASEHFLVQFMNTNAF